MQFKFTKKFLAATLAAAAWLQECCFRRPGRRLRYWLKWNAIQFENGRGFVLLYVDKLGGRHELCVMPAPPLKEGDTATVIFDDACIQRYPFEISD